VKSGHVELSGAPAQRRALYAWLGVTRFAAMAMGQSVQLR
jgi:hypothetical protein